MSDIQDNQMKQDNQSKQEIDNPYDNEIQRRHDTINKTIYNIFPILFVFFGCYMIYYFLPISTPANYLRNYQMLCCEINYNLSKCSYLEKCKEILSLWISFQNTTRDLLNECCYYHSFLNNSENRKIVCDFPCLIFT